MKNDRTVGLVVLAFAMIPLSTMVNGFVTMKLWNWFIPQTFHLTSISIVQALGLSIVVKYLAYAYHHDHDEREADEKLISAMVGCFFIPFVGLLSGYIISRFL